MSPPGAGFFLQETPRYIQLLVGEESWSLSRASKSWVNSAPLGSADGCGERIHISMEITQHWPFGQKTSPRFDQGAIHDPKTLERSQVNPITPVWVAAGGGAGRLSAVLTPHPSLLSNPVDSGETSRMSIDLRAVMPVLAKSQTLFFSSPIPVFIS